MSDSQYDSITRPSYYLEGGIETIQYILAKNLDYLSGNVVKYVTRAPHKGRELEDLKKARRYLDIKIYLLELEEQGKENAVQE